MICPTCKGDRRVFRRVENIVTLGYCPTCNGTGEIKATNFQRITASPEKLAEFVSELVAECELRCKCGLPHCWHNKKVVEAWLGQEEE